MMTNRTFVLPALAVMAMALIAPLATAATITSDVENWVVHNGTSTPSNETTNDPTFAPGDNITVMAPLSGVRLADDGDYLTFSTTLTMANRSTTGVNTLNTQLRLGLFDGPAGPVVADDIPNVGLIIEYTNQSAGGLIREQTSTTQTNPFVGPTNIGNGSSDTDSIAGADPPPVLLELTLTRNGGKLDLAGTISGGDHLANYSVSGYSSATFPMNGVFEFDRVGIFLGNGVNAESASLSNATITTNVPEPATCAVLAVYMFGIGWISRQRRSIW